MADSDSTVAWHRIQLKKLREDLRNIEIRRFRVGEATDARARSAATAADGDQSFSDIAGFSIRCQLQKAMRWVATTITAK